MRTAIVDDAAKDRKELAGYLVRWGEENAAPVIVECFENGEMFLKTFAAGEWDVIFLDVFLAGMDGMETARRIRAMDKDCRLIFSTATDEFAVESYEVASSWYLVKPYGYEKLKRALERCGPAARERYVTVPGRFGPEKLPLSQVAWTEYENRRVHIHFLDGGETWAMMNQGEFAPLLLAHRGFCDCMKGLVVHFAAVEKLLPDSFLLRDGQRLPISRLKYRMVREQFLDYSYGQARGGPDYAGNR
ncbi:MAG: response regulator transcription factor [Oscillibacter sp.]|jgi:DNA-binding LytR/AlgR family response regulator|nr:response regulator transcription factor [Oscillibacter sp.]MCI8847806.1 response regulator transcription factor [Oscillibacter sp.]MCI9376218.1 response regulator transcription factor [Oscillibacter sp.]